MEIEVTLRISNRIVYLRNKKFAKVQFMENDGWKLTNQKRTLFSTTYSFSKII